MSVINEATPSILTTIVICFKDEVELCTCIGCHVCMKIAKEPKTIKKKLIIFFSYSKRHIYS